MSGKFRKFFLVVSVAVMGLFFAVSPVYAIGNPTTINFGTGTTMVYNVFYNVLETGDWLITTEGYVYYTVPPTDYTASEAFLFELLNTAGTAVLASTPLNSYGDRPISIYLTATQVGPTGLNLTVGGAYGLRLTGNPLVFASPTGNTKTVYLNSGDYINQAGATDVNNPLRDNLIMMATNIQAEDILRGIITALTPYIVTVQGVRYLTILGGSIFLEGINSLSNICPILFQSALEVLPGDIPESTGTYARTMTPERKWGTITANGLTNLGIFLGINQALAGSVMLFVLVIMLAVYVYKRTQSGIAMLMMVAATPFLGAYLALMPMALAFIFTIFIVVLVGYFFLSRGAL